MNENNVKVNENTENEKFSLIGAIKKHWKKGLVVVVIGGTVFLVKEGKRRGALEALRRLAKDVQNSRGIKDLKVPNDSLKYISETGTVDLWKEKDMVNVIAGQIDHKDMGAFIESLMENVPEIKEMNLEDVSIFASFLKKDR